MKLAGLGLNVVLVVECVRVRACCCNMEGDDPDGYPDGRECGVT